MSAALRAWPIALLLLTVPLAAGRTAAAPQNDKSRAALSEAIKVDQVGYLPARPKLAMVTDTRATGAGTGAAGNGLPTA